MDRWAAKHIQAASEEMQAGARPRGEGSKVWARQDHKAADGGGVAERSDGESEMFAFNKEVVDEKIDARL